MQVSPKDQGPPLRMSLLLSRSIAAALGGLGLGLGSSFLVLYVFSGGLFSDSSIPTLLLGGVLLLLGGPIAYSLYLKQAISSVVLAIIAEGVGAFVAYVLALIVFAVKRFLFGISANFFQDFLALVIIFAALVIITIQVTVGGIHRKDQRVRLAASVTPIVGLLLVWPNTWGKMIGDSLNDLLVRLILYPTLIWLGAVIIRPLIERIAQLLHS